MASRLALVNRWLSERSEHHPSHATARPASVSRSQSASSATRPEPDRVAPENPPPAEAKTPEPAEEDQPARL
jgi:hypothetical protein